MTRVLVTGGQGQLGRCIQDVSKAYSDIEFFFRDSKSLDISNFLMVDTILKKESFDYCINCAAYTNVQEAEKNPDKANALNGAAVRNLATLCKETNTILIHISTDYVFDGEKEEAYTIQDHPNPINAYGKSKLLGERYIQDIMSDYFIIRTTRFFK